MSLLNGVKDMMTNAVIDKAASAFGIESGMARSAMKMILPAVVGGVINKGSSQSGASALLDLFKKDGLGDGNIGDLMGVLGDSSKRDGFLEQGGNLLGTIFGGNKSGLIDMVLKATGLSKGKGASLLSFVAPIVINKLAGIVMGKGMNASGLASYLSDQKDEVMGMVPGLSAMLGGTSSTVKESVAAAGGAAYAKDNGGSGGGGFIKWLLPLLIAAAAIYYFAGKGCGEKAVTLEDDTTTEQVVTKEQKSMDKPAATTTTTTTTTTTEVEGEDMKTDVSAAAGYTLADNGDILNASGSIAHTALSYDVDADGNLIGTSGSMIAKVTDLSEAFRTKLASMLPNLRLNRMKTMFSNMIVKKEGAEKTYALSNIEFKPENHMISNFSKAEVQGLAAALKENKTGQIEVQVYTADGKNAKDNNKRSDKRAQVIRDMLVTLGVGKDQIKAVGMGDTDAEKAKMGKVDIVVN
jgi:outer membrane protein OmpA-like peptidoglycan-associated protein